MRFQSNVADGCSARSLPKQSYRHGCVSPGGPPLRQRHSSRRSLVCEARGGGELTDTIKIKHREISALIKELGQDVVEQRLVDAQDTPLQPQFQLVTRMVSIREMHCRPAVILEIARPSPASTRDELVELAKQYSQMGADVLCLKASSWNDWAKTLQDVFAISRAVKVPLLLRDIFLHPVQVVDAKQAGASGILGLITAVTGPGTPVLSSFACSLGMDAPVEVVNLAELSPMMQAGAAVFGINISVGLSMGIAGARMDTAAGILRELPHDCMAVVGIQELEEAKQAAESGAHALLIKARLFQAQAKLDHAPDEVVRELMYQLSGDD